MNQLKQQLDAIITQTKAQAAKQNAALHKEGLLGEAWSYTEAFLKGAAQSTKYLTKEILPQMTVQADITNNVGLAIWKSLQQGNTDPIKQDFHKLKSEITATAQDYQRLNRLLTDPDCVELLVNFPKRYFKAASTVEYLNMLGRVAPVLILAIITKGKSATLEGSEETAAIAEEIGGAKGTIKRQAVQMIDQGEVESDASKIKTIKLNAANSAPDSLRLKAILALRENDIIDENERLTPYAIDKSRPAMRDATSFGNTKVVEELTSDGSNISDWKKAKTPTVRLPSGQRVQVHYYRNIVTDKINYNIDDYKIKGIIKPFN